jgi:hypothetical protein
MQSTITNTLNPLTHIINMSLSNGIVPNSMKMAKVISILKDGDRMHFTNYCSISSKILEKIIAKTY